MRLRGIFVQTPKRYFMKLFRFFRVLALALCALSSAVSCDWLFDGPDDPYSPSTPSTPGGSKYTISVSPKGTVTFPADGGTVYFAVSTNADKFGASFPKKDWLKLAFSKDSDGIDATVTANDSGSPREFQITFWGRLSGSDENIVEQVVNCVQPAGSGNGIGATYSVSETFQSDLDAIVTYALDIRALRWAYFNGVSKGFTTGQAFSSSLNDIDGDYGTQAAALYADIVTHVVDNADEYDAALQRFQESGVFTTPTTKGTVSDYVEFLIGCKKAQVMGRQSVMAILREAGWNTDTRKLKQLYDALPDENKRGCSDYADFWNKFSKGDLDSRVNQVFVNLYSTDAEFGATAKDLGVTPGRNMVVAGTDLCSKGYSLVLDACPYATQVGYGKDLFGAVDATCNLVVNGDVEGFLKNAAGNIINYGNDVSKIIDKMTGNKVIYWEAADNFWESFGKDIVTIFNNDVMFSEELNEATHSITGTLIPNIIKTHDANGQEINLLVMVDGATGQMTIGYVLDEDGNIIVDPKLPGVKYVTVVNKNTGKRVTKPVTVSEDKPTTVKVNFDEESLSENPADGYIQMRPPKIEIPAAGGENWQAVIVSNYLYYAIDNANSTGDWIKASVAKDNNLVYLKVAANTSTEKRSGTVTVNAVDSKGKKLNSTVLKVEQAGASSSALWISADPDTMEFPSEGGTQETEFSWSQGLKHVSASPGKSFNDMADYDWVSTDTELKMKITVYANNTGEDRSGTITVYAGLTEDDIDNAKAGNLDPNRAAKTTIVVSQAAKQGQFNSNIDGLMLGVTLYDVVMSMKTPYEDTETTGSFPWDSPGQLLTDIQTSGSDKNFTLKASYSTSSNNYGWNNQMHGTVTLTVKAADKNDPGTYTIESIDVTQTTTEESPSGSATEKSVELSIKASIPCVNMEPTSQHNIYAYQISGSAITTSCIRKGVYTYKMTSGGDYYQKQEIKKVNNNNYNSITINLNFPK